MGSTLGTGSAREARRDALGRSAFIGLDWVEVQPAIRGDLWLVLHFVPHSATVAGYDPAARVGAIGLGNIVVEPEGGDPSRVLVSEEVCWDASTPDELRVRVRPAAGAPSIDTTLAPAWLVRLVGLSFVDRFFVECSFRLVRTVPVTTGAGPGEGVAGPEEPLIDYTARDFDALCQVMYDRLAIVDPSWTERHTADLGVTIVEALAYAADRLSYYQDAVATEAYLTRARRRISMRRHARLLDYALCEGCNARAWVRVEVSAPTTLPKGTALATQVADDSPVISNATLAQNARLQPLVFETMESAELTPEAGISVPIYDWGATELRLLRGATSAFLAPSSQVVFKRGDVLLFEEHLGVRTGKAEVAEPSHLWFVRLTADAVRTTDPLFGVALLEIQWALEDAPPFDLVVTTAGPDGEPIQGITSVYGNVVLVDEGKTTPEVVRVASGTAELSLPGLTFAVPVDGAGPALKPLEAALAEAATKRADTGEALPLLRPASTLLEQDPLQALPQIVIEEQYPSSCEGTTAQPLYAIRYRWTARADLLASNAYARDYVVEIDDWRRTFVRFGDGVMGREPRDGTELHVTYRVGNGSAGNVARDTIRHVVGSFPTVTYVTNPTAACGGTDPEDIETARRASPSQIKQQHRCVTTDDYVARALQHAEVALAAAEVHWTGTRAAMIVHVERSGGRPVDAAFAAEIYAFLAPWRIAGVTLRVSPPRRVPLRIALEVTTAPGWDAASIRAQIYSALGARLGFQPSLDDIPRIGFGESVWLSDMVSRALGVPGVWSVGATQFGRLSDASSANLISGVIEVQPTELVEVANDPRCLERGLLELDIVERI